MSDAASDRATASGEQPTELKRVMGPKLLLLFIVGDILGTGVYALTGEVARPVAPRPSSTRPSACTSSPSSSPSR